MCLIAGEILEGSWSSLAVEAWKTTDIELRSTPFRVSSRVYSRVRVRKTGTP